MAELGLLIFFAIVIVGIVSYVSKPLKRRKVPGPVIDITIYRRNRKEKKRE
jgi:hypothetical protein